MRLRFIRWVRLLREPPKAEAHPGEGNSSSGLGPRFLPPRASAIPSSCWCPWRPPRSGQHSRQRACRRHAGRRRPRPNPAPTPIGYSWPHDPPSSEACWEVSSGLRPGRRGQWSQANATVGDLCPHAARGSLSHGLGHTSTCVSVRGGRRQAGTGSCLPVPVGRGGAGGEAGSVPCGQQPPCVSLRDTSMCVDSPCSSAHAKPAR